MTRLKRAAGERVLVWVGLALEDLRQFPEAVKDAMGVALSVAQFGGTHAHSKPWRGEGPGVFEVVADYRGDTYRAVYTVRFAEAVLRPARVSKEVAARSANGPQRCGTHPQKIARGARGIRGAAWLGEEIERR